MLAKYQSECPNVVHQIYWQRYEYTPQTPFKC